MLTIAARSIVGVLVLPCLPVLASAQAAITGPNGAWLAPSTILPARYAKIGAQFDF